MIKDKVPKARFVFIGGFDPNKVDAIRTSTLDRYGIADVAQCLGHRSRRAPDSLRHHGYLRLPSHREGASPRAPMDRPRRSASPA